MGDDLAATTDTNARFLLETTQTTQMSEPQ